MQNTLNRKRKGFTLKLKKNKGFTLVELIVVIAIIGILVLLAMPKFMDYTRDAKDAKAQHDARVAEDAVTEHLIGNDDKLPENLPVVTPEDIQTAIEEGRVFNPTGPVAEVPEGSYVDVTDLEEVKAGGIKTDGTIISNNNGDVFIILDKAIRTDVCVLRADQIIRADNVNLTGVYTNTTVRDKYPDAEFYEYGGYIFISDTVDAGGYGSMAEYDLLLVDYIGTDDNLIVPGKVEVMGTGINPQSIGYVTAIDDAAFTDQSIAIAELPCTITGSMISEDGGEDEITHSPYAIIVAGGFHSMALTESGEVYAWGENRQGRLGDGTTIDKRTPTKISLPGGELARDIAAGYDYSLILTTTGEVYAAGYNGNGRLGDGTTTDKSTPTKVAFPAGVTITKIKTGHSHSIALSDDGKLYGWGYNSNNQLGDGPISQLTPRIIDMPSEVKIKEIGAGDSTSFIITDNGDMYGLGANSYGQLGIGDSLTKTATPIKLTTLDGLEIKSITGGTYHTLALTSTGAVYAFGYNNQGQLGLNDNEGRTEPVEVTSLNGIDIISITARENQSLALGSLGEVYAWGDNGDGDLGLGDKTDRNSPTLVSIPGGAIPIGIATGWDHSLVLIDSLRGYSWGYNSDGQLGDGTTTDRLTPTLFTISE